MASGEKFWAGYGSCFHHLYVGFIEIGDHQHWKKTSPVEFWCSFFLQSTSTSTCGMKRKRWVFAAVSHLKSAAVFEQRSSHPQSPATSLAKTTRPVPFDHLMFEVMTAAEAKFYRDGRYPRCAVGMRWLFGLMDLQGKLIPLDSFGNAAGCSPGNVKLQKNMATETMGCIEKTQPTRRGYTHRTVLFDGLQSAKVRVFSARCCDNLGRHCHMGMAQIDLVPRMDRYS